MNRRTSFLVRELVAGAVAAFAAGALTALVVVLAVGPWWPALTALAVVGALVGIRALGARTVVHRASDRAPVETVQAPVHDPFL